MKNYGIHWLVSKKRNIIIKTNEPIYIFIENYKDYLFIQEKCYFFPFFFDLPAFFFGNSTGAMSSFCKSMKIKIRNDIKNEINDYYHQ
jgi:hypothetical protein